MANTYNALYFLHIAKTGGRYISYNVINPMLEQLEQNNIKIISPGKLSHFNWHSGITDQTYILSLLRDPVQQCVSLYVHEKTTNFSGTLETNKDINLSKKDFYNTILSNNNYQNYQSKNFLSDENRGFGLRETEIIIDEVLLEKRIKRVNLLLNQNNLNNEKIQEKIFLDLGINKKIKNLISDGLFYNPYSEYFYSQFSDAEKKSIAKYNEIDYCLYKNSKYHKL